MESDSFHGVSSKNPFKFHHHDLTRISVEVDGISYPTKPYMMNFAHGKSLEAYDGLLDVLGRKHAPHGSLMFDRSGHQNGYAIYGFSLSPSGSGLGELGLIKQGNMSISLAFQNPTTSTLMAVSLFPCDSMLEIDHFRQLFTDFSG